MRNRDLLRKLSNVPDDTNSELNKKSNTDHTHKYAGSSTAGGVATEAAKTTGTLTIKGNSTTAIGTYNGSTSKTVTITPANIGAATSGHGHNYAGSSTDGGAATSANKVNSSLTIQGNGTELATFNGSAAKTVNITPDSIGASENDHGHSTLTVKGNSTTAIGTYDGTSASTITITPANIGAAASSHTHNYAGSSSAGGAATSANKVNKALTLQTNGTEAAVFDGSAAKTVNITPDAIGASASDHGHSTLTIKGNSTTAIGTYDGTSASTITITPANIGAAASSHTHNYAGSSSAGGSATSANKVNNALTVQGNGTELATFDGSSAKTVNITPSNIGAAISSHTHGTLTVKGNSTTAIGTYNGGAKTITITPANIGAATSDHTHGTLTVKGSGTSAIGTYNGGASTITITPTNIGAASETHGHNYAASASDGGAATSANKVNNALTIQTNGTEAVVFDGSAVKSVNITPANIGAATSGHTHSTLTIKGSGTSAIGTYNGGASTITITPANIGAATSDHTHNYAGSSSAGGAATSANKVNKALTININGSEAAVFDGSVAKTVNITTSSGDTSHGLVNSTLGKELDNTTTGGWSIINDNYTGFLLMSLRTNTNSPDWILPMYSAGIAFGGSDTKGVMSVSYYQPRVRFAGGAGESPSWYYTLSGTSGTEYNLNSFATTSYVDNQLGDIASILQEINGE